jgi:hypothetical protein
MQTAALTLPAGAPPRAQHTCAKTRICARGERVAFFWAAAGEECLAVGSRLGRTDPAAHSVSVGGARKVCRKTMREALERAGANSSQVRSRSGPRKIINARRRSFEDDLWPQPTLRRPLS